MTKFIKPTEALLDEIEPEAGEVARPGRRRPRTEFFPNWGYIANAAASTKAVVAALTLSYDVPEHVWDGVIRTHCPRAFALVDAAAVTPRQAVTGAAPAHVVEAFTVLVNTELGGYEVLVDSNATGLFDAIVDTLGGLPTFGDPRP